MLRRDFLKTMSTVPIIGITETTANLVNTQNEQESPLFAKLCRLSDNSDFIRYLEKIQRTGNQFFLRRSAMRDSYYHKSTQKLQSYWQPFVYYVNTVICNHAYQELAEKYKVDVQCGRVYSTDHKPIMSAEGWCEDTLRVEFNYGLYDKIGWETIAQEIDAQYTWLIKKAWGRLHWTDITSAGLMIEKPENFVIRQPLIILYNTFSDTTSFQMALHAERKRML